MPSPGHPGRVYSIPYRPGRITVYEDKRPMRKLCVAPFTRLPPADRVLMHKLMIEGNEERYLRTARYIRI